MMKDKASFSQDRFSCASSAVCLRWLSYLDLPGSPREQSWLDLPQRDLQQVAWLQLHLSGCVSCTALLQHERNRLAQQRTTLQQWLDEAEQRVPSTVGQILSAISRETPPLASIDISELEDAGALLAWPQQSNERNHMLPKQRSRRPLRTVFALVAAAALIFTGFGIFHQITVLQSPHPPTQIAQQLLSPSSMPPLTTNWSSLVLTRFSSDDKSLLVENYDPLHKRSVRLLSACCSLDTVVDGVSHAGDNLLYHAFSQEQTSYHLLSGQGFVVRGRGSNAIWSTDDQFIYAVVGQQLLQYDVNLQAQRYLAFSLPVPVARLQFYYRQYLYFSSVHDGGVDLYRVNLANGHVQTLMKQLNAESEADNFWLSPSGTKIYYVNTVGGADTIFACNLDGSNQQFVVKQAVPVGYAADNTLIALRSVRGTFQLVKLAASPLVLVKDLAPGARSLSAQDVALAPYAGAVVASARYDNGSVQLWSTDLASLQQQVVLRLPSAPQAMSVHLIGWDRLSIPQP